MTMTLATLRRRQHRETAVLLRSALIAAGWVTRPAAERLGISRAALCHMLRRRYPELETERIRKAPRAEVGGRPAGLEEEEAE